MKFYRENKAVAQSAFIATVLLLLWAAPAAAYVGPGVGLTAIGSLLALAAAIVIAIIAFVWFPLRRRLRARKQAAEARGVDKEEGGGSS